MEKIEPWVGRIRTTGAIVVFDPALQLPDHSKIYVYSLHRALVRQFVAAELRAIVETVHGSESDAAIHEYYSWKAKHADEFLHKETLRLAEEEQRLVAAEERNRVAEERNRAQRLVAAEERTRAAEERIRAAHRQRLEALGIDPTSIDLHSVALRQHRTTRCYACKCHLDSEVFLQCSACQWIICSCGACGCGYRYVS